MKITATRNILVKGTPVATGETIETDDRTAADIILMRRAVRAAAAPTPAAPPPKPAKGGRPKAGAEPAE